MTLFIYVPEYVLHTFANMLLACFQRLNKFHMAESMQECIDIIMQANSRLNLNNASKRHLFKCSYFF